MSKHVRFILVILAVGIITVALTGCGNKAGSVASENKSVVPSGTAWQYAKTIAAPITQTGGKEAGIALGDLNVNNVAVTMPAGALDTDTAVTLSNPDSVPNYAGDEAATIGAPIEISASQPTRLNEAATISFKFDPATLPAGALASELRVVYYDGTTWEYIKPKTIDLAAGSATFETYHFSLFGMNQIKKETKLTEEWIHSQTLDSQIREQVNSVSDHVANQVIDLTLEKMGISDKSIKGQILGELLKNDSYKKLADSAQKGDVLDVNQKIAVLAGKKIAELVPKSAWQAGLKGVIGAKDDIEAVSKAAGFATEGRYEDAAKIIGEQIADKFLITTAGKIAVEVVNGQVDSWKNKEVEAAYNAYKDGANGVFWGYNVDKGDFNGIWDQMRGIRRQLEIEAIAKENAVRAESGMQPLTEAQADGVRLNVQESYRRQFELRVQKEAAFEAAEKKLKLIMDGFRNAGFFDSSTGPVGLDKGFELTQKLEVLNHFAEKIMRDTKRFDVSDKNGLVMADKISIDDIVQGARYWFSGPEGIKQYKKFLKDRFNISLYPELKDLAGTMPGALVINDVYIDPALKAEAAAKKAKGEDELGCDFNFDLSGLIGKSNPITLTITPSGDSGGTLTFQGESMDGKPMPFTYAEGVLTASLSEKGAVGTMTLDASADPIGLDGFIITYEDGKAKITATIKAVKPVAPAAPATAPSTNAPATNK